ncbi:zinc ABC transporter substrate-binding protein ZnuA [Pelagibacterium halotolerans]|uniref:High-affinity zinc uptake system protein ZnuA n=1 Tax=Pelagibacterium halotolerans (strain DSM 22347 / JCM 15775 / CGMCC 1.7692 / B2) TaxID=1082931 RepID=G4REH6_PELHB|nr:zinc ABC transporter substrate-binding protein ZnuA [Pelagibacterium halotolerans]AEQ53908.1 zinc ABC transporter, periplasmic-binding protein ZnuA [Pelagibacterium halotolerans B2]QJR19949.1 zinc ABC transporter substrate-binding protein ZnuA [Pelagibacterium halotolerans]SEA46304.1 zinc transport system substrate-binding protein [Pelagibacterium halotolerans]
MPNKAVALLAPAAVALFAAAPALAAPNVVATIKPLHSLVAGVMDGVGAPELLIEGAASPHGFSLRPSDAGKLESADLVFWIGEDLETFLDGPLDTLAADATKIEMMDVEGMNILELREGGLFEAHSHGDEDHEAHDEHAHEDDHDDHDDHAEDHDHEHGDAHIWLDPDNARLMVAAIADALIAADPENAETYNANGQALVARLDALQAEIDARLAPARGKSFFVFHDAYHGFEQSFDIEATGSFTVNPEIAPGAGRLTEIRAVVEQEGAACLFAEPQFSPQVIETIAEGTGARIGTLDPLGADIADGPELYFTLMNTMADNLLDCLVD